MNRPTLLATAMVALALCFSPSAGAQRPDPRVAVTAVQKRELAAAQNFVATVRPTKTVMIGSAASGRVAERFYGEGDRVEAMEPLVQLLTETIDSEIAAAEAELTLRQSALEELRNGVRPEEREQAEAQMLAADARRQYAETNRDRVERLYRQGSSSVNERDEAVTLYANAINEYIAAKKAYELAELGPREEKIAQAQAAADRQAAMLQKLKDQKRKHTIICRFAGYVIEEHTEVGAWLNTGDLVAEVAALDEVDVEAFVTEDQVPNIRVGMEVTVEVPALDGRLFVGQVREVIPQADVKTRTFPVRVRVSNEIVSGAPLIKAGMLARVQLPIGPRQQALLVPKDALVFNGERSTLFVVTPDPETENKGSVQPVPVRLGVSQGELIQVIGGIETGQLVVVEGNERLRPGQNVIIAEVRSEERSAAAESARNEPAPTERR